MSVKFGFVNDLHFSASASVYLGVWGGEWRIYSNASSRFAAAVATWNAQSTDFNIQAGDLIDGGGVYATELQKFKDEADNLTDKGNDFYHLFGHHDRVHIQAARDYWTDLADYWGAIENLYWDATDGAEGQAWGYTFDRDGFRFIVCWTSGSGVQNTVVVDSSGNDQLNWLENTALNTALPVVVIAHGELLEAAMTVVKASGLCHLCLHGHDHREKFWWDGDVPCFRGRGSLRSDISIDDTTSNAYYIVEIDPNRIHGVSQWKGIITITGYELGVTHNLAKWTFGF